MSLLDRLETLTRPGPSELLPLRFGNSQVGWIDQVSLSRLATEPTLFELPRNAADAVALRHKGEDYETFSARLNDGLRRIYDADRSGFGRWMDEPDLAGRLRRLNDPAEASGPLARPLAPAATAKPA